MGRKRIARLVKTGEYQMTRHAYQQMIARDIFIRQVEDAILNGKVARTWDDREGKKYAIVGDRFNGDSIKVVVKDTEIPKVVTVCYPYEDLES